MLSLAAPGRRTAMRGRRSGHGGERWGGRAETGPPRSSRQAALLVPMKGKDVVSSSGPRRAGARAAAAPKGARGGARIHRPVGAGARTTALLKRRRAAPETHHNAIARRSQKAREGGASRAEGDEGAGDTGEGKGRPGEGRGVRSKVGTEWYVPEIVGRASVWTREYGLPRFRSCSEATAALHCTSRSWC